MDTFAAAPPSQQDPAGPPAEAPKKKKAPVVLGCDQCRRRKTKCDHAKPSCGPCQYAGLMECTFLLGKPPPPKRKKAKSEVEILEARLQTIESAYSERLKQMEDLLNRVMPGATAQELPSSIGITAQTVASPSVSTSTAAVNTKTTTSFKQGAAGGSSSKKSVTAGTKRSSPKAATDKPVEHHERSLDSHSSNIASVSSSVAAHTQTHSNSQSPKMSIMKEEVFDKKIFIPQSGPTLTMGSPTSSIASSLKSSPDMDHDDTSRSEGDPGGLAATMDKLRLFDASLYYGKGSIFFTSTDKNHFWDEEISFDVHDVYDIDIPPEATILPPVEAIDMLIDIYYSYYHPFLPMIQKATLLRALEDRYESQNIFLLNSVFMAVALTGEYSHPSTDVDPKDPKSAATPFFKRARMMLDYCIGVPRVSTVQGLLMLCHYPTLGYSYLQQAMLMAADLGLHRKCDRWIPDKQVQETRKRVFWCVYSVDSISASITGRRPLIDDNEIDVPMLAPITGEGEVEYSNALSLIHLCKLWRIFRNVKRYIFNAVEVQEMVPGSLPKSYEQQLIQWQLQLPAVLRFSFDVKEGDSDAMYNARAGVAQMLYESTLIMLHKPYLTSEAHLEHQHDRSRDICIKAASKITDMNRILNTTYVNTFAITGIPEYSIVNAVRIQVMYMNSEDPAIADINTHNFDYLMTFFLEYYSSPRANYDEQTINCILTFFDEFMHSVKGLSETTVHMCECAIKNLALAKRARLNSSRQHGGAATERDPRNLSKLVRIGKEEHERERAWSSSSPSSPHHREVNLNKKRLSTKPQQHGCGQHRESPGKHSPYQINEDDFLDASSTTTAKSEAHVMHSGLEGYLHPGKFQKVSQYVGPFGGPEVMESFNIYQTSNAILNQPPTSHIFSMPLGTGMMSAPTSTMDMYPLFDPNQQHTMQLTGQPLQSLQSEPHNHQLQHSSQNNHPNIHTSQHHHIHSIPITSDDPQQQQQPEHDQEQQEQQPQEQQKQEQQQQQQQFFGQVSGQSLEAMNAFDSSFWNHIPASAFQTNAQLLNQNILESSGLQGTTGHSSSNDQLRQQHQHHHQQQQQQQQANGLFELSQTSWQGMA
ncbi:hypothetical protein BG004_006123 [Podila humilis]|nr:hypothetical protein BG004_006123 [Podila humilis]